MEPLVNTLILSSIEYQYSEVVNDMINNFLSNICKHGTALHKDKQTIGDNRMYFRDICSYSPKGKDIYNLQKHDEYIQRMYKQFIKIYDITRPILIKYNKEYSSINEEKDQIFKQIDSIFHDTELIEDKILIIILKTLGIVDLYKIYIS